MASCSRASLTSYPARCAGDALAVRAGYGLAGIQRAVSREARYASQALRHDTGIDQVISWQISDLFRGAGMNRKLLIQVWILFGAILANFIAQVVYFFHLYYTPQQPLPSPRSLLLLGGVFALFLVGYTLFIKLKRIGFYLLALFLFMEFTFYLWNLIGAGLRGPGWFFHLSDTDPILWLVFAIGYLNLFASGYFLFLLWHNRQIWLGRARA
jgi:hypothetical protein